MPLHILLPFGVFMVVMALMTVILLSVFFICRHRQTCKGGLLDSDVSGTHNICTSSLISIDKDEFIESIQPKAAPGLAYRTDECSSICSASLIDTSTCDTLSLKSEVGTLVPTLYQKQGAVIHYDSGIDASRRKGKLCLHISYRFCSSDLVVRIEEATDLILPGTNTVNAFVRLTLDPPVDERKRQTSTFWSSSSPKFQEEFRFPLAHDDIAGRRLQLHLFHRASRAAVEVSSIGWAEVPLSLVDATAEAEVWTDVSEQLSEWGEVLLSLSYLPAARRLTVGVSKARGLSLVGKKSVDVLCRLALSVDGRVVKRKATTARPGAPIVEWHEVVVFHDVAPADLPNAEISLSLEGVGSLFRSGRALSRVTIGPKASGAEQWFDMKVAERKNVSVWHPLGCPEAMP